MDWGMIIVMVLVIPFITFMPALFLAGLFFGLYELIRDAIRGKAAARRRLGEGAPETLNIQKIA
jgi:hypothetical protein